MIRSALRKMGPLMVDHPCIGDECPACNTEFVSGDYVCIVALGPGASVEERRKCRENRPYNAVGAVVHWACATGEVSSDEYSS